MVKGSTIAAKVMEVGPMKMHYSSEYLVQWKQLLAALTFVNETRNIVLGQS